jgi:hypothetical protein
MKGNKKAGFFPLFAGSLSKSNRCCGPGCDCSKPEKNKTVKDTKKK